MDIDFSPLERGVDKLNDATQGGGGAAAWGPQSFRIAPCIVHRLEPIGTIPVPARESVPRVRLSEGFGVHCIGAPDAQDEWSGSESFGGSLRSHWVFSSSSPGSASTVTLNRRHMRWRYLTFGLLRVRCCWFLSIVYPLLFYPWWSIVYNATIPSIAIAARESSISDRVLNQV